MPSCTARPGRTRRGLAAVPLSPRDNRRDAAVAGPARLTKRVDPLILKAGPVRFAPADVVACATPPVTVIAPLAQTATVDRPLAGPRAHLGRGAPSSAS